MKREILFISDLHLSLEKTEITRRFLEFLASRAPRARALYILGDLFDAWIGDDDNTPPIQPVKRALNTLVASGTAVYLMLGNRDFLLSQRFAAETGVKLLGDYELIDLNGRRTLLTHGDLLCSDDVPYQAFRAKSRSPEWQQAVLSKPLWLRLLAARWYRLRSYWHKRQKSAEIMDVNPQTVEQAMRQFGCSVLIHGHTHRPAKHELIIDGVPAQRWVLADWKKDRAECLCWHGSGFATERY
ncbi:MULTISPECIES: UDP-2,3-diacylglucosamine diphosphatase [Methylomonas]|uniref:UDP-2,3-diacylglucosamine diphosphatase n=1 Tax=Methylomonas TaxID=416 RepID=UPI0012322BB8|nr:UDP-2,3-diacylglucosamine diphosphatase [Methylomonas rhizoryzae]